MPPLRMMTKEHSRYTSSLAHRQGGVIGGGIALGSLKSEDEGSGSAAKIYMFPNMERKASRWSRGS